MEPNDRRLFQDRLLTWYDSHARILPWRSDPTPYRVWISEIMLQQTRVDTVIPYFERFLSALPDVGALAAVDDDRLLKLWEGLGYYNRARNLKKAANQIMEDYAGILPDTKEELAKLPGIGPYASGSIASIAFGRRTPAVDGNVLRVLARIGAVLTDLTDSLSRKAIFREAEALVPAARIGDFNQAMMELGALVCLPNGKPDCLACPVSSLCRAHLAGLTDSIPGKAGKTPRKVAEKTVFLIRVDGKTALHQRPKTGLLAGLWEFPNVEGHLPAEGALRQLEIWGFLVRDIRPVARTKHVFTHLEWEMIGYSVTAEAIRNNDFRFVSSQEMNLEYPLPTAFRPFQRSITD